MASPGGLVTDRRPHEPQNLPGVTAAPTHSPAAVSTGTPQLATTLGVPAEMGAWKDHACSEMPGEAVC